MHRALITACLLAAVWCAPVRSPAAEPAREVSLVSLLAHPQAYDGKLIRVEGFFDGTHPEDCRLYLSRDDFDYSILRNSIYVTWPDCFADYRIRNPGKMESRYVRVEGLFRGDMGPGYDSLSAIPQVRSLTPLKSRADFYAEVIRPGGRFEINRWIIPGILFVALSTLAAHLIARRVYR